MRWTLRCMRERLITSRSQIVVTMLSYRIVIKRLKPLNHWYLAASQHRSRRVRLPSSAPPLSAPAGGSWLASARLRVRLRVVFHLSDSYTCQLQQGAQLPASPVSPASPAILISCSMVTNSYPCFLRSSMMPGSASTSCERSPPPSCISTIAPLCAPVITAS